MADETYVKVTKDMAYNLDQVSKSMEEISKLSTGILGGFIEITKTSSATGQAWTSVSRFFSGSGFWKVQNKIKAVSNALQFQVKMQEKRLKREQELTNEIAKYESNLKTVLKTQKGINEIINNTADADTTSSIMNSKYFKVLQKRYGTTQALYKLQERTLGAEEKARAYAKDFDKARAGEVKSQLRKIANLKIELTQVDSLFDINKKATENANEKLRIQEELDKLQKGMLITDTNTTEMSKEQLTNAAKIMDIQEQIRIVTEAKKKAEEDSLLANNREEEERLDKLAKNLEEERQKLYNEGKEVTGELVASGVSVNKKLSGEITGFDSSKAGGAKPSTGEALLKFFKIDIAIKMWEKKHLIKKWLYEKKNNMYNRLSKNGLQTIWKGLRQFIMKGLFLMLQAFLVFTLLISFFILLKQVGFFEWFSQFYKLAIKIFDDVFAVLMEIITVGGEFIQNLFGFIGALFDPNGNAMEAGKKLIGSAFKLLKVVVKFALSVVIGLLGVAGGLVVTFFTTMYGKLKDWLGPVAAGIVLAVMTIGAMIVAANLLSGSMIILAVTAIIAGIGKMFDFFDTGGVSSGGMAIVGERGPELVNLPTGARVHSNKESNRLVTGGTNNITVNVQGRIGANDQELRDIASKVGKMISLEINRNTSTLNR